MLTFYRLYVTLWLQLTVILLSLHPSDENISIQTRRLKQIERMLALIFAAGMFIPSAIYAHTDTTHNLPNLDLYQDGSVFFGVYQQYDTGRPKISMAVSTINPYYSGKIYCNLNMIYRKKQLIGEKEVYEYTKT